MNKQSYYELCHTEPHIIITKQPELEGIHKDQVQLPEVMQVISHSFRKTEGCIPVHHRPSYGSVNFNRYLLALYIYYF